MAKTTAASGNRKFPNENNDLQFVSTGEGRARLESGTWKYDYFLKDHLGNVRMMLADNGTVLEETHYYPFGLQQKGISYTNTAVTPNKYKFGTKELDSKEFTDGSGLDLYDFGARNYDPQIGRWLQIDPMAGKYYGTTPYNYVDGNPIVRDDPNGEDWFRNERTGEIEWREIQGKQGEQMSLKGSKDSWMNLGSELLVFDGESITYYTQYVNDDGKLKLGSQSFDAVSGKPLHTDPLDSYTNLTKLGDPATFEFSYSKDRQAIKNEGPTPEGLYSVNKSAFKEGKNESGTQKWSDQPLSNKMLSRVGRGTWPGGTNSWGDYRWRLNVEKANTYGRKDMYLHGGTKWGSRGCIDVGNNVGTLANAMLTNKTGNDKVYLQAVYPHDMQIKVASGTTNHLQKVK